MRWFKHDSEARNDPKLRLIRDRFHARGYGTLMCMWEVCAGHGEETERFRLPFDHVQTATDERADYCRKLLDFAAQIGHVDAQSWTDGYVCFPAMQARADEYTRKRARKRSGVRTVSGQSPRRIEQKRVDQEDLYGDEAPQVDALIRAWNETTTKPLPQVRTVNAEVRKQLGRALKAHSDLGRWRRLFAWLNVQPWGRKNGRPGHENFTFSLRWLMKDRARLADLFDRAEQDDGKPGAAPESQGRTRVDAGKYAELDA